MAVPYQRGMRPFENVAFQWSWHSIEAPGAEPIHTGGSTSKMLILTSHLPRSLMNQLGRSGTVYMWATHENSILGRSAPR
ncbi:MAG: DUF2779 domain-containing protein [Anaerolineales bacterium]|nr:DUF2779 domain-containing protein [Anaerolineales bacterium]